MTPLASRDCLLLLLFRDPLLLLIVRLTLSGLILTGPRRGLIVQKLKVTSLPPVVMFKPITLLVRFR